MSDIEHVAEQLSDSGFLQNLSPPIQMSLMLGSLVLLPAALACLTCFTRIVIVLSFVRRGMSTQEIPPNSVMMGLALFLTFFIMQPTWNAMSQKAVSPYLDGRITGLQALQRGATVQKAFLLRQTRKQDLALFLHMSQAEPIHEAKDTPLAALVPAFIISELKTAFLMGFCVYLPFLLVDIVVSTVLMSMGMMMMPPVIISTPFKVLLFVLADGWHLIALAVNQSFL